VLTSNNRAHCAVIAGTIGIVVGAFVRRRYPVDSCSYWRGRPFNFIFWNSSVGVIGVGIFRVDAGLEEVIGRSDVSWVLGNGVEDSS